MRAAPLIVLCSCASAPVPQNLPADPGLIADVINAAPPAVVKLDFDRAWYFSGDGGEVLGTFTINGRNTAVRIERVGNVSKILCRYSKLRLSFEGRKLYVVTHCNDAGAEHGDTHGPSQLYGQYLAHVVRSALQIPGLNAQLASISYFGEPQKPALLVEDAGDRARALGAEVLQPPSEDGPAKSVHHLDPPSVAAFHLFQILIGNRDWKLFQLKPLERRFLDREGPSEVHNVFIAFRSDHRAIPLPLDFDVSTFAGLSPAMIAVTGGEETAMLAEMEDPDLFSELPVHERWFARHLLHFWESHGEVSRSAALIRFKTRANFVAEAIAKSPVPAENIRRATAELAAFERALQAVERLKSYGLAQ